MTTPTILDQSKLVCTLMQEDYSSWMEERDFEYDLINNTYEVEEGRNYIKIVRVQHVYEQERKSVCGFIVKATPKGIDNKTKQPFQIGDMLMAKSYTAPATNFARGNVFDLTQETKVRWTGI